MIMWKILNCNSTVTMIGCQDQQGPELQTKTNRGCLVWENSRCFRYSFSVFLWDPPLKTGLAWRFVLSFHFQYPKIWIWIQKMNTHFQRFHFQRKRVVAFLLISWKRLGPHQLLRPLKSDLHSNWSDRCKWKNVFFPKIENNSQTGEGCISYSNYVFKSGSQTNSNVKMDHFFYIQILKKNTEEWKWKVNTLFLELNIIIMIQQKRKVQLASHVGIIITVNNNSNKYFQEKAYALK